MSPLQTLTERQRTQHATGQRVGQLTIRLDQIPADLMLAFTAERGWHWALSPSDAEWRALEA